MFAEIGPCGTHKGLPEAENSGGRGGGELRNRVTFTSKNVFLSPERAGSEGKFRIMLIDHSNLW